MPSQSVEQLSDLRVQRRRALGRANEVRALRAALKVDLHSGQTKLADVLLDPEPWLATMRVRDLLLAVPKVGHVKQVRALREVRISPTITIARTSRRSRVLLLAWIVEHCPSVDVGWERGDVAA